jgi:hypothetical protein
MQKHSMSHRKVKWVLVEKEYKATYFSPCRDILGFAPAVIEENQTRLHTRE